jgi:predicted PurR-regulated permease PerM
MGRAAMKFTLDRKYLKICLYAFFTVAALLILHRILQSSDNVLSGVSFLLNLLSPFITAVLIAYILNPAISGLDRLFGRIFGKDSHKRGRKLASLLIIYSTVIAGIVLALSYVIPGIFRNIGELIYNLPDYQMRLTNFYTNVILPHPLLANEAIRSAINTQIASFAFQLPSYISGAVLAFLKFGVGFFVSVASFVIGLILSFYLLNERERIVNGFTKLLRARLGEMRSESVMGFLKSVDRVFGRYISAKLLICVIMFAVSFAVFALLGVRYLVLMAAIVALSTLVPFIGPFVGAVPPIVIALLDSPQKAIYVAISLLVMHIVDGYFIEPVVFGEKMGLSPFWILFSIILGGGLFGIWGVLLAVPVAAVLRLLITGYIRSRQARRQREQDQGPTSA